MTKSTNSIHSILVPVQKLSSMLISFHFPYGRNVGLGKIRTGVTSSDFPYLLYCPQRKQRHMQGGASMNYSIWFEPMDFLKQTNRHRDQQIWI